MIKENTKYIIAIIAGFLLALLLFKGCEPKETQKSGPQIKTDTIYKIQDKIIYLKDTIVKLKYKDREVNYIQVQTEIEETLDTGYVTLFYSDYLFKYDTTQVHQYGESKISIKGFGYVNQVDVTNTWKDTTTTITKEITKYKSSKGLYLSPEYNAPFNKESNLKPIYKLNLDYVKGNWILGGNIGVQNDIPMYGIRLGYKLN